MNAKEPRTEQPGFRHYLAADVLREYRLYLQIYLILAYTCNYLSLLISIEMKGFTSFKQLL